MAEQRSAWRDRRQRRAGLAVLLLAAIAGAGPSDAAEKRAARPRGRSAPASSPSAATTVPAPGAAEGVYTLIKDGRKHEIPTVTRDGEDFLALAELTRAMGGAVAEVPRPERARVAIGGAEVEVEAGAADARVDGRPYSLSRPAVFAAGRLWVPTDFATKVLAAALERAVKWKDEAAALLAPAPASAAPARGDAAGPFRAEVDVRSQRDYTRVLVRVPGVSLLPYTLNAPHGRIVLRIQAGDLGTADPELLVADGALERVAFEVTGGRGTFTLELGSDYREYQHAVLRDPFRVVIDLYRKSPYTGPPARIGSRGEPPPSAPAPPEPAPGRRDGAEIARAEPESRGGDLLRAPAPAAPGDAASSSTGGRRAGEGGGGRGAAGSGRGGVRTVVVDAGHGGSEPGARGPGDLLEKELTLDLARRLGRALESNLGLRVVLTRSADIDLSLDDRTGIANHEKADLFVSIHANASLRANARGAETYFLSQTATDDESRKLAALENQALGEARGFEGTDLELILWSLAQNQYLQESQELAETIQKELNDLLGVTDRGVKQAPFKVLVGATMPAVLVEVGFITNPEEEKRLRDDEYKNRIVTALYQSVRKFRQTRVVKMGELGDAPAEPAEARARGAAARRSER